MASHSATLPEVVAVDAVPGVDPEIADGGMNVQGTAAGGVGARRGDSRGACGVVADAIVDAHGAAKDAVAGGDRIVDALGAGVGRGMYLR